MLTNHLIEKQLRQCLQHHPKTVRFLFMPSKELLLVNISRTYRKRIIDDLVTLVTYFNKRGVTQIYAQGSNEALLWFTLAEYYLHLSNTSTVIRETVSEPSDNADDADLLICITTDSSDVFACPTLYYNIFQANPLEVASTHI